MSDPQFLACWPHTLSEECPYPNDWSNPKNFSNDPNDPGGATMCGIIQSEYNLYRVRKGLPQQPVIKIIKPEGYDIYYNNYWLPHCPLLPAGLNLDFFDECVNAGPTESIKILQYALNITTDGIWGPQTLAAIQALQAAPEIIQAIKAFTARRAAVYRMLSGFPYFGTDWEERTQRTGNASLTMVEGS